MGLIVLLGTGCDRHTNTVVSPNPQPSAMSNNFSNTVTPRDKASSSISGIVSVFDMMLTLPHEWQFISINHDNAPLSCSAGANKYQYASIMVQFTDQTDPRYQQGSIDLLVHPLPDPCGSVDVRGSKIISKTADGKGTVYEGWCYANVENYCNNPGIVHNNLWYDFVVSGPAGDIDIIEFNNLLKALQSARFTD